MAKWHGTFGFGQKLAQNFVSFEADGYEQAADIMRQHYGSLWACIYTEGAFVDQPLKYHITEVPLGTPNSRDDSPACEQDHPEVFGIRELVNVEEEGEVKSTLDPACVANRFVVSALNKDKLLVHSLPIHALSYHDAMVLVAWLIVQAREIAPAEHFELMDYVEAVETLIRKGQHG